MASTLFFQIVATLLMTTSLSQSSFNIFGTAASSSSDVLPNAAGTIDAREETRGGLAARIDKLFLEKSISNNCAMCLNCLANEQIGTIWCYSCGNPMEMQEKLPLTHAQILSMIQDSSKKLLQELGLRVRETDSSYLGAAHARLAQSRL